MSLLQDAQRITEYRIPTDKAQVEISEDERNYILRLEDETLLGDKHETEELPDTVKCPDCMTETAEQDEDDQLYICTKCGRETVRLQ